jgi:outer membrane protein assembly factor BamB
MLRVHPDLATFADRRIHCCLSWTLLLQKAIALFISSVAFFGAPNCTQAINLLPHFTETAILHDPDPGRQDSFGWSLDVENDIAIVGMPGATNGNGPSEAAFVYRTDTLELLHVLEPVAPDGMNQQSFGTSVAISGNLAVVGSRFEHVQTSSGFRFNAGAAHVYNLDTGQHVARLVADDASGNVFLGEAVAIDGNNVLVGGRAGAVYVFDALSGEQLAKLEPSFPTPFFGNALALEGSLAVIGAAFGDGVSSYEGAVQVFDIATGSELRTIVPSDAAANDYFGAALDVDGNIAVIGSSGHDALHRDSGAAYVFNVTTGHQLAKLQHPAVMPGQFIHGFGLSVAIDEDKVAVGVPTDYRHGFVTGTSFLFDWTTEAVVAEILPRDMSTSDYFGSAVAMHDSVLVASNMGKRFGVGSGLGTAYVFRVPEPSSMSLLLLSASTGFLGAYARARIDFRPPPVRRS